MLCDYRDHSPFMKPIGGKATVAEVADRLKAGNPPGRGWSYLVMSAENHSEHTGGENGEETMKGDIRR